MTSEAPADDLNRTLAKAAEGDPGAWRVLVERYSGRVYGLVLKQCGDRELAEEITQATFVTVVSAIRRYRERGKFEPWLFRIAMNRLRDEMRRRKRQARPMDMTQALSEEVNQWGAGPQKIADLTSDERDDPVAQLTRAEQVGRLRQAVAQLSAADQEILYLRHTAGLSFYDIARTLEQPLGTVLARGHRAVAKLRKMLTETHELSDR